MDQTFGKSYKLCSRKLIAELFKTGSNIRQYPFSIQWKEAEGLEKPFQMVISAPKRQFRRAHDRNRIKRLMREAIRMNKLILEESLVANNKQLALFVIYTSKEELPLSQLLKKSEQLFRKLIAEIANESTTDKS